MWLNMMHIAIVVATYGFVKSVEMAMVIWLPESVLVIDARAIGGVLIKKIKPSNIIL